MSQLAGRRKEARRNRLGRNGVDIKRKGDDEYGSNPYRNIRYA